MFFRESVGCRWSPRLPPYSQQNGLSSVRTGSFGTAVFHVWASEHASNPSAKPSASLSPYGFQVSECAA